MLPSPPHLNQLSNRYRRMSALMAEIAHDINDRVDNDTGTPRHTRDAAGAKAAAATLSELADVAAQRARACEEG